MQITAMRSRFLIDYSSEARFADSEIVVSQRGLIQHILRSQVAQTIYSQEAFLQLANTLIDFAEQAYTLRDLTALDEVSSVLMNLPIETARQIGVYYHALALNRKGKRDEADALLQSLANKAPAGCRARAIQTLGANQHDKGQLDEALRAQIEALRAASDRNAHGLQTTLMARFEISHVRSDIDDHRGALAILESVCPLVHTVAKQRPFYFYLYHNELAIELGELGRIVEAKAASDIALASPYAHAYPNWAETRRELEAKRTSATPSIVAIRRAPDSVPSTSAEPQRDRKPSRPPVFNRPASNKNHFQISVIPAAAAAAIARMPQPILD
ncbi:MAG: hypothetical protein WAV47_19195, partial [Blastocatellia bacterium]